MSLCIATAAVALQLAVQSFTLSWIHSVERTEWREHWRETADRRLVLVEARVRGSGAGVDPPLGAVLQDGWWVWPGGMAPVTELRLAVSGATVGGWQWCSDGIGCRDLERWMTRDEQRPGQIVIRSSAQGCRRLMAGIGIGIQASGQHA